MVWYMVHVQYITGTLHYTHGTLQVHVQVHGTGMTLQYRYITGTYITGTCMVLLHGMVHTLHGMYGNMYITCTWTLHYSTVHGQVQYMVW